MPEVLLLLIIWTVKKFPPEVLVYPEGVLNLIPGVPFCPPTLQFPVILVPYVNHGAAGTPGQALKSKTPAVELVVVVMDPPVGPVTLKVVVATGLFTLPPPPDMVY